MATLSAFRHVVSSGSGCQTSKGNLVDENAQFVPSSSMRAPSPMRFISSTSCISTIPPQPHCNTNNCCERAKGRPKQVTDPLNELVRARLCGNSETCAITTNYCSSGSDHDPNSARLADMVYGFMEEDVDEEKAGQACSEICEVDGAFNSKVGEDDSNGFNCANVKEILQGLVSCTDSNGVEDLLHKESVRAVEVCKVNQYVAQNCNGYVNSDESSYEMKQKSWLRRCVMNRLRDVGYNAGVCKSQWEQTAGFPATDYEYIDVIIDGKERVLVDIDFRVEFEIARPTCQYNVLVKVLPEIFVGKADRLKQIIKIMSDSAKKSLKKKGMHLPPWRKYPYMKTKWLGPYKRTTNAVSGSSHCSSNELRGREIGSIALKGRGWDHGFKHQMELHYEKAMKEDFNSKAKLPKLQTKCGSELTKEWMPPSVIRAERGGKVSALASAFKETSFTCFPTVDNAQVA